MGGKSTGIYKSLNCAPGSFDNKSYVLKNLQIVIKKIRSKSKKIILLNQKPTQVPSTVWCSSLIGFIYYNLNLIKNLNWKLLSPEDWSYKNNKLLQLDGCSLNKEILLNKFIK